MKALLKSRFPFVELPDEELNKEQLSIKKQYNDLDKLREVHSDDKRTGRKSK